MRPRRYSRRGCTPFLFGEHIATVGKKFGDSPAQDTDEDIRFSKELPPIESATGPFVRGACTAIALFARGEISPRRALEEMGMTRALAEESGVNAFDLLQLKQHWPKPVKAKPRRRR